MSFKHGVASLHVRDVVLIISPGWTGDTDSYPRHALTTIAGGKVCVVTLRLCKKHVKTRELLHSYFANHAQNHSSSLVLAESAVKLTASR